MAGTQWDKLGQMDAAFEIVAPAIRRVAQAESLRLQEFHNEDPVWRLAFAREQGGEARIDIAWEESQPDVYQVRALWWIDDYDSTMRRFHEETVGEFRRDQPLEDLETLLRTGLGAVDEWDPSVLDRESGPNPDWKKYRSREDFQRIRLPKRP
ncbi:MAG: hypothetical protein ACREPA_12485 [Candidatus Dormibacteraceae bacterium]